MNAVRSLVENLMKRQKAFVRLAMLKPCHSWKAAWADATAASTSSVLARSSTLVCSPDTPLDDLHVVVKSRVGMVERSAKGSFFVQVD